MGFTNDLASGIAQLLEDEGLGVYNPTGSAYTTGQVGIYLEGAPETAHSLIVLTLYPVAEPIVSDSVIGLQVRTRVPGQDPRPIRELDDDIHDALNGRSFTVNGIRVSLCEWRSGASLGLDSSKRWNRSANYYLTVARPSPHRL